MLGRLGLAYHNPLHTFVQFALEKMLEVKGMVSQVHLMELASPGLKG